MMSASLAESSARIYEDDDIVVFWHQGATPYVLITFADLIGLTSENRFFADTPVIKNTITCLGFVAKTPNWYPAEVVARALFVARPLLELFTERIVYGGSMGGYGAIRHSASLQATCVIALCPQWSLDRQEWQNFDPGFRRFFSPALRRMGIRAEHAAGKIFVFYDPDCAIDRGHAEQIMRVVPMADGVHVFNSDHHVTPVFAGSSNLMELIALARTGDVESLGRLANRLRRWSMLSTHVLLERAVMRHPLLALRASRLPKAHIEKMKNGFARFHQPLLRALIDRGDASIATSYLNEIENYPLKPEEHAALQGFAAAITQARQVQSS
jgi:hypothetical protein